MWVGEPLQKGMGARGHEFQALWVPGIAKPSPLHSLAPSQHPSLEGTWRGHSVHHTHTYPSAALHSSVSWRAQGAPPTSASVSPAVSAGLSDGAFSLFSIDSGVGRPKCTDQAELGGVPLAQSSRLSLKVRQTRTGAVGVVSSG